MYRIEEIRKAIEKLPEMLTIEEAASFLRLSYITVYRMVQAGEICATKIRKVWRIPKSGLLSFLEEKHPFNLED